MKWDEASEASLASLVDQYDGEPRWKEIADAMPSRNGRRFTDSSCRTQWFKIRKNAKQPNMVSAAIAGCSDKKTGKFNWRDVCGVLKKTKEVLHGASSSQDRATVDWSNVKKPICIVGLSDLHMGSWGTDLEQLEQLTDQLLSTEGLYAILLGDLLQMSVNLRGNVEQADNSISPERQMDFLDSWLKDVKDKVIASCWDNHSVMREEKATGFSMYKWLMSRSVIYNNGIGHLDLKLGKQTYKFAISHVFRGRSMLNPVHGQMRYARMEAGDREIIMAGDSHVPGVINYFEQGQWRIALNGGTLQTNSGYAKRHFSLTTSTAFPCVQLFPDEHLAVPYRTVGDWLKATGRAA